MKRVISLGPIPPEPLAYALARYSRSPDSIRASLDWVKAHDSSKFLDSFYFQYGHASIADLGHLALCFEGISEIAAIEIEDEQLWDGQARSSRYQDFSRSGFVAPPELDEKHAALYRDAAEQLLAAYRAIHERVFDHLCSKLPRPDSMKPDAYQRNIAARAFDVARYLLFLGIPTGVGQVTSIRTLERQIRRWKASDYAELRELGAETASACTQPADCAWTDDDAQPAVAPTLAKYVEAEAYPGAARESLRKFAEQVLPPPAGAPVRSVELTQPTDPLADIAATLLYPVTHRPFAELYSTIASWSRARKAEVLDAALAPRGRHDEMLREFRGAMFAFDMLIDIGAYRDMHRHRRCQQFRQDYTWDHGFETPAAIVDAGLQDDFNRAMHSAVSAASALGAPASHYLLPFGHRGRFLFKMDFAEAEYISKLRSGVKGHFSYRNIAWEMKQRLTEAEPELGALIQATPPWIEDPLVR